MTSPFFTWHPGVNFFSLVFTTISPGSTVVPAHNALPDETLAN